MSTKEVRSNEAAGSTSVANLDMKLEVVVLPVSDVDRAKEFYSRLGWRLDADRSTGDNFRVIQFTPPGSGSSIIFGINVTSAAPGSAQALHLTVSNIAAARQRLVARGVKTSEVFHCADGTPICLGVGSGSAAPIPSIAATARSPRSVIRTATAGCSRRSRCGWPVVLTRDDDLRVGERSGERASRAAAAHGQHEARTGQADSNWPDWYAEYMVREQAGQELPQ